MLFCKNIFINYMHHNNNYLYILLLNYLLLNYLLYKEKIILLY